MSHAKVQDYRKQNRIRHRKSGKSSLSGKMVGLGNDGLLISDITDTTMELEISSEEECDGGSDMQRLIPSPVGSDRIASNGKKEDLKRNGTESTTDDESVWSISIQMFIPFLLAGFGMVAASLLLDVVQVSNIMPVKLLITMINAIKQN